MKYIKIKSLLIALACFFFTTTGTAQESIWNFSWDVAFATGETSDYIDRTSFRGFTIQGRHFVQPNISVGGSFGWQIFNEIHTETVEFSYQPEGLDRPINGAVTGDQYRYINALPILVNTYYYMGDALPDAIRPYAGMSLGLAPVKRRTEIGVLSIEDLNWHFDLVPEAGILIPLGDGVGLTTALKYNFALKANDSINYSYFGISVGLASIY